MPRNRHDRTRQAKRDEILAAASSLFLAQGYDGASMGKIAAAAGLTPNTLYWYFSDKDELFVAVAEIYLDLPVEARVPLRDLRRPCHAGVHGGDQVTHGPQVVDEPHELLPQGLLGDGEVLLEEPLQV